MYIETSEINLFFLCLTACNRRAYIPDERMYFEDITPQKAIMRECAPGTAFEQNQCHCSRSIPYVEPEEGTS